MAKNDYHVIAYRILIYLYECLKSGERINERVISAEVLHIVPSYWDYIMIHLYEDGYIEGVSVISALGGKTVKMHPELQITPKGIEFLEENSMMGKAKEFLKTLKETIPGF